MINANTILIFRESNMGKLKHKLVVTMFKWNSLSILLFELDRFVGRSLKSFLWNILNIVYIVEVHEVLSSTPR